MVKVIVTPSTIGDAKNIFSYYEANFSHSFSKKLLKEFVAYVRRLEQMPEMGPKESLLEHLNRNYRYVLVQRRYKLVYLYEHQTCFILMIWDCRQDPKLLENSERFS
jgi:plasmid stabilization system protein ParE